MKPFLVPMFLLAVDVGVLITYLNAKKEKMPSGVINTLGYIVIILSIITLISFFKL